MYVIHIRRVWADLDTAQLTSRPPRDQRRVPTPSLPHSHTAQHARRTPPGEQRAAAGGDVVWRHPSQIPAPCSCSLVPPLRASLGTSPSNRPAGGSSRPFIPAGFNQRSNWSLQEGGARAEQKAAMADEAELAADQHVRYIVTVEKVTSAATPPHVPSNPPPFPTPALVVGAEEGLVRVAGDGAHPPQRRLLGPHHARPPPQAPRRRRRRGRRLDHVLLPPRIWYLPFAQSSLCFFPPVIGLRSNMILIRMCDLLGLYVAAQADLEGTLGTTRMSSTPLVPCRSSASSIGSMSLMSTRLLIVSFFPDFELGSCCWCM